MRDIGGQALLWTRTDFLALRYELQCEAGLVAELAVAGAGSARHALGQTSGGAWKFEVFPFDSGEVLIARGLDDETVGRYFRTPPFAIHLVNGASYRAGISGPLLTLENKEGSALLGIEQLESFPLWKATMTLNADVIDMPDLPVLMLAACCICVFK